jgi:hypothetical protein
MCYVYIFWTTKKRFEWEVFLILERMFPWWIPMLYVLKEDFLKTKSTPW